MAAIGEELRVAVGVLLKAALSLVTGFTEPPVSRMRESGSRLSVRKRMSPPGPQVPSWNPGSAAIMLGGPPPGLTFFNLPSAKKASHLASGDQGGQWLLRGRGGHQRPQN